jgi:ribosomal protein S18 acetylase RimI-like enzyme
MENPETPALMAGGGAHLAQLTIRHLVKEDLIALEWGGEYTHFRRLYAKAYERAQERKAVLWVAELGDSGVIGQIFVQLSSWKDRLAEGVSKAYIYSFRVHPAYRNLGIGTRLLEAAEADLTRRRVEVASLNVARDNQAARRLYERRGYRVVRAEPGVWQYVDHQGDVRSVHEPAWRMEKSL